MQQNSHRSVGQRTEKLARQYLEKQGLKLITQNFYAYGGEIDLIMRDKDFLVFIEVRLRTHANFGKAIESVTFTKQKRLIKTAQYYLLKHTKPEPCCRFDILGLDKQNNWQWIKNAFQVK